MHTLDAYSADQLSNCVFDLGKVSLPKGRPLRANPGQLVASCFFAVTGVYVIAFILSIVTFTILTSVGVIPARALREYVLLSVILLHGVAILASVGVTVLMLRRIARKGTTEIGAITPPPPPSFGGNV